MNFRKHIANGRECERGYQNHGLWIVKNYGQR
jgi:hypothetical protein